MSKYTEDKNYIYYPNTSVPINKLDIRDQKTLEAEERKFLLIGYEHFHKNLSKSTLFDEKYFKKYIKGHSAIFMTLQENTEQSIFPKDILHFVK